MRNALLWVLRIIKKNCFLSQCAYSGDITANKTRKEIQNCELLTKWKWRSLLLLWIVASYLWTCPAHSAAGAADLLQKSEASQHLFALCIRGNLSWSPSTNECTARLRSLQDLINTFLLVILQSASPAGQPCHLPTNLTINLHERTLSSLIGVRHEEENLTMYFYLECFAVYYCAYKKPTTIKCLSSSLQKMKGG